MFNFLFKKKLEDFVFPPSMIAELKSKNEWSEEETNKYILEYKKFMAKNPSKYVVPDKKIYSVWDQHILYTESYKSFCKIVGYKTGIGR